MPAPIVLDLDGVLVDTERAWAEVRRELTLAHGGTWHDGANGDMQGLSTREWAAFMVERLGVRLEPGEVVRRVTEELEARYAQAPPFLPGAIETVRRLAQEGRVLGLASSSPRRLIEVLLDAGGIAGCFATVVSSEEVERGKPSPDVFLEAARRLGVAPGDCVAVEDSASGLRAAAAAGMEVLAIPNPHDPPADDALRLATRVGASLPELL